MSGGVADQVSRVTRIPRDRFDVIYNAVVTPALVQAAKQRAPHPWFEDRSHPVVLGAGRLVRLKNFAALIEAFERVVRNRNARLVILGEGPERAALEGHVRRLGLQGKVALPGFLANPYACMARASVFALSSDWEGLPTVLIESLALGTPVVSTDCESGPREVLRNGALGHLVAVGDVPALTRALSRALDGGRITPPSEALRPFTPDVVLDQYQRVFGV